MAGYEKSDRKRSTEEIRLSSWKRSIRTRKTEFTPARKLSNGEKLAEIDKFFLQNDNEDRGHMRGRQVGSEEACIFEDCTTNGEKLAVRNEGLPPSVQTPDILAGGWI